MLEILVVPACFLVAGLIGYRLGTPPRVAGGLVALGCFHLLAFLGAHQALSAEASANWIHLVSQLLFLAGFAALVWLASTYPDSPPSTRLMVVAGSLVVIGPFLAGLSGPTPVVLDDSRELGPVFHVLPDAAAGVAAVPLVLLPLLAVITFVVRFWKAEPDERAAMRWPIAGLALIAVLVAAGTLLGPDHQGMVSALFLLGAPVFPLAVAFGPVVRQQQSLAAQLAEVRGSLGRHSRAKVPPGVLARLTPRELTVLEGMAQGMANPVIARAMHLSLSSVEKHATSIFRKLEIPDGPEVHRRVAAVVAFRDALDSAAGEK